MYSGIHPREWDTTFFYKWGSLSGGELELLNKNYVHGSNI